VLLWWWLQGRDAFSSTKYAVKQGRVKRPRGFTAEQAMQAVLITGSFSSAKNGFRQ
jgi:hypothetical protein